MSKSIWKTRPTVEAINQINQNCLVSHLGIEIIEVGDDYIRATMPVDSRHVQPARILHGGASVVLSESLGSMAGFCLLDDMSKQSLVGVEINANHLRPVPEGGRVTGTVRAIRIGRKIQVWETQIEDENGKLVCVSRLTTMIVDVN
ncbi:MAG: hotdog fold thioesterase [Bacteroidota bacterium]